MVANLKNPFGESCCDGGECSVGKESARPCGCDPSIRHVCKDCTIKYLSEGIHFFFKRILLSELDDVEYKYFHEVLNLAEKTRE